MTRRALIGLLAGALSSTALWVAMKGALGPGTVVLGSLIGAGYALLDEPQRRGGTLDGIMTAAALGIPLWTAVSVIAIPLLSGGSPAWTAPGMRAVFPELVGWVIYGATLGLLTCLLGEGAARFLGPVPPPTPVMRADPPTRIVILGGGFAGVATAQCLEQVFGADRDVELVLVSETNALLFTPMLAEVAGSSLEPTHISSPLRTSVRRTRVVRGFVEAIDVERRRVTIAGDVHDGNESARELEYDHLVLALGAVSNYFGQQNVQRYAFPFKTLADAIRIRNHVIDMFERADRQTDPALRTELLTFVVAGGGFAGVELAGALNDFARGILVDYPRLQAPEVRVVLVHGRERILPELSPSLAAYALERMTTRGVTFKLTTRVADARPGAVVLDSGEEIPARTLAWTAGTAPNPLLSPLPVERNKHGAVIVESTLSVPARTGLWALGDCAAVTDVKTGLPCPPTAQVALREARILAKNLHAALRGGRAIPFRFRSLGALCVIGHQTACAELIVPLVRSRALRFSGLFAWILWRGVYLSKLPGFERKVRVLVDWTIELFFPRDTVQTLDVR